MSAKDPSLKLIAVLALTVVIPILILLLTWGDVPASMPESQNIFLN